jgi:hypothetical protein
VWTDGGRCEAALNLDDVADQSLDVDVVTRRREMHVRPLDAPVALIERRRRRPPQLPLIMFHDTCDLWV